MTTKYVFIPLALFETLSAAVTSWETDHPEMTAIVRGVYTPNDAAVLTDTTYQVGKTAIQKTVCLSAVDCDSIGELYGFNLNIDQSQISPETWVQIQQLGGVVFNAAEEYMQFERALQNQT